jgi:hypothetical protein
VTRNNTHDRRGRFAGMLAEPSVTPLQRLMLAVTYEALTGCWLFTGRLMRGGHGSFFYDGTMRKAHRVSWQLHRGPIPAGLQVLHDCDVPCCVNPLHLYLGTNADNVADRVRRGRSSRDGHPGDSHPLRKVDAAAVQSIRSRLARGERQCDLAAEYGLSRPALCDIAKGRRWRGVA